MLNYFHSSALKYYSYSPLVRVRVRVRAVVRTMSHVLATALMVCVVSGSGTREVTDYIQ